MNDYSSVIFSVWPERSDEVRYVVDSLRDLGGHLATWRIFPEYIEAQVFFESLAFRLTRPEDFDGPFLRDGWGRSVVTVKISKEEHIASKITAIAPLDHPFPVSYVRPSSIPETQLD